MTARRLIGVFTVLAGLALLVDVEVSSLYSIPGRSIEATEHKINETILRNSPVKLSLISHNSNFNQAEFDIVEALPPTQVNLNLIISSSSTSAAYTFSLPRTSGLARALLLGHPSISDDELAQDMLGSILVGGFQLRFGPPNVFETESGASVRVSALSNPQAIAVPGDVFISSSFQDKLTTVVRVATQGTRIVSRSVMPTSASSVINVFRRPPGSSYMTLRYDAAPAANGRDGSTSSLARAFAEADGWSSRYLGSAGRGLFGALPIIGFLWVAQRRGRRGIPYAERFVGAAQLLLALHVGLWFLLELSNVTGPINPFVIFFGIAEPILLLLGMGVLWPAAVRLQEGRVDGEWRERRLAQEWLAAIASVGPDVVEGQDIRRRSLARRAGGVLALGLLSIVPIWIAYGLAIGIDPPFVDWGYLLLIPAWLVALLLLMRLLPGRYSLFLAGVACLVLLNLALLDPEQSGGGALAIFLRVVPLGVVATVALLFFIRLAYSIAVGRSMPSEVWYQRHPWLRVGLVVAVALLSFPLQSGSTFGSITWDRMYSFMFSVDDLIPYAFVLLVIVQLKEFVTTSSPWPVTQSWELGVLLAAEAFFAPSSAFLLIPITLIIGIPLMAWLLSRGRMAAANLYDSRVAAGVAVQLAYEIERDTQSAEHLRRRGVAKVRSGDVGTQEVEQSVTKLIDRAASHSRDLGLANGRRGRAILALGPCDDAWQSGLVGARTSALLALPWIGLFMLNVLRTPRSDLLPLSFVASFVYVVVSWGLYGFFFGYFYRSIRGESGLAKGLAYAFVLVVPNTVLVLLLHATQGGAWTAYIGLTLEVFVNAMLLGAIVGDLGTLRRADLGIREMMDMHDFGAITAWGSGLVVAIGGAVTAVVTSEVTSLLTAFIAAKSRAPHPVMPSSSPGP